MKLSNEKRDLFVNQLYDSCKEKSQQSILKDKMREVFYAELWDKVPVNWSAFEKFFIKEKNVSVQNSLTYRNVYFEFENYVFIPYESVGCSCRFTSKLLKAEYPKTYKIYEEYINNENKLDEVKKNFKKILYSVNTTNQLFELIPEARNILEFDEESKSIISVELINSVRNTLNK